MKSFEYIHLTHNGAKSIEMAPITSDKIKVNKNIQGQTIKNFFKNRTRDIHVAAVGYSFAKRTICAWGKALMMNVRL